MKHVNQVLSKFVAGSNKLHFLKCWYYTFFVDSTKVEWSWLVYLLTKSKIFCHFVGYLQITIVHNILKLVWW